MKKEVTFELAKEKIRGLNERLIAAYEEMGKVIGYMYLSADGRNRFDAIAELDRCAEFSVSLEEFVEAIRESDVTNEVKRYIDRYMKTNLGIEIM